MRLLLRHSVPVHVFGEFRGLPVLLARTAVGDKPGDCKQGDLIGDPALAG
ncbi:hypothetical protein [Streptomyces sp. NPDC051909]